MIATRRYGGKHYLLRHLLPLLPHDPNQHFVDVFGGGGAVLLNRARVRMETYNDIDRRLVNFFRVLRDHPEELVRRLRLTPYSRVEYERSKVESDDLVEDARRFAVAVNQSVMGAGRGWSVHISRGARAHKPLSWQRYAENLRTVSKRFLGVQVECRDALDLLRRFDCSPDMLFYCDPPYHPAGRVGKAYEHEMSASDHEDFLDLLGSLESKVVLSGYNVGPYRDLDWERFEFDMSLKNGKDDGSRRTECVWRNFGGGQASLFGC